jgi:hypothetical protein
MIGARCRVIPNEVRDLSMEDWLTLSTMRAAVDLCEVLRFAQDDRN